MQILVSNCRILLLRADQSHLGDEVLHIPPKSNGNRGQLLRPFFRGARHLLRGRRGPRDIHAGGCQRRHLWIQLGSNGCRRTLCICRYLCMKPDQSRVNQQKKLILSHSLQVILITVDISGGMLNPMLATVMLSRCSAFSWQRHLFIYWIGGLTGTVLAHFLCSTVKAIDDNITLSQRDLRLKIYYQIAWPLLTITEIVKPFILILRNLTRDLPTFFAQLARPFLVLRGLNMRYIPKLSSMK